jgi:hypothetical protein
MSSARAAQHAERAIAPLQAQSAACFKATVDQRKRKVPSLYACVITVASAPGETCIVTVTVPQRDRRRPVTVTVTIPLRCFATPAPLGQIHETQLAYPAS